jgi:hypothetical protein
VILREIDLIAPRPLDPFGEFVERRSRSTCALLGAFLKRRVRDVDFWKISISVNWSDSALPFRIIGGVLICTAELNRIELEAQDNLHKSGFLLEWICRVLQRVFANFNLDLNLVNEASAFVREHSFENRFKGPASKEVRGDRRCWVEVVQGPDAALVQLVVQRARTELERIAIADVHPDEFRFAIYLQPVTWISSKEVVLRRADGVELRIALGG